MTTESHDAASKLAWRDRRIAELEAERDELRRRLVEIQEHFLEADRISSNSFMGEELHEAKDEMDVGVVALAKLIEELKQGDG